MSNYLKVRASRSAYEGHYYYEFDKNGEVEFMACIICGNEGPSHCTHTTIWDDRLGKHVPLTDGLINRLQQEDAMDHDC